MLYLLCEARKELIKKNEVVSGHVKGHIFYVTKIVSRPLLMSKSQTSILFSFLKKSRSSALICMSVPSFYKKLQAIFILISL